jgi:hypothetical protein
VILGQLMRVAESTNVTRPTWLREDSNVDQGFPCAFGFNQLPNRFDQMNKKRAFPRLLSTLIFNFGKGWLHSAGSKT